LILQTNFIEVAWPQSFSIFFIT